MYKSSKLEELLSSRKNQRITRIVVENRSFDAAFWEDDVGLRWCAVGEVVRRMVKPHWYSRKLVEKEVFLPIDSGHTSKDRVQLVYRWIQEYLDRETMLKEESRKIDELVAHSGI